MNPQQIIITNSQRSVILSRSSITKAILFLLRDHIPPFSVHLIGKKKSSDLHAKYFGDPSPTDCMTFPYEDPLFLGEIFICPKIAQEYVEERGGNLEEEITLYLVHGYLHLLGYRDTSLKEQKKMRQQEQKWMKLLRDNNLILQKKENPLRVSLS